MTHPRPPAPPPTGSSPGTSPGHRPDPRADAAPTGNRSATDRETAMAHPRPTTGPTPGTTPGYRSTTRSEPTAIGSRRPVPDHGNATAHLRPTTGSSPATPTGNPTGHRPAPRSEPTATGNRHPASGPATDHSIPHRAANAPDHPTRHSHDRPTGHAPAQPAADTRGNAPPPPAANPTAPPTPTSLFPGVPGPPSRRAAATKRRRPSRAANPDAPTPEALPQTADRRPKKRRRTRRHAADRPEPPRFPPPPGPAAADNDNRDGRRAAQARRRIMVGVGLLAVWGAVIGGRLVQTQVFHHEAMLRQAAGQHRHGLTIPPFRGEITDRNGRPLAVTVPAESVYASPPDYTDLDLRQAAAVLARCLDRAPAHLERRLRRPSQFSWLRRKAAPEQVECARESGYPIDIVEEYRRAYPAGSQAAHLIGYVGVDGNGLGGAEHALDALIRGEPGRRTVWTDGRRTGHRSRVEEPSRPGADVRLTVDLRAQAIAEEELIRGAEEIGAVGGAVVLLESRTGEVLALAGAPTFDPNRYGEFPSSALRNQAFTDPYEPGSVFKIVTAAAALEEGVTHEEEPFETFGGKYRVGNRTVSDWKPLGPLTFAGVIRRSSNIGTLQVARRLGSRTLHRYLRAFGFGEPTGLGGSGESRGIVPAGGVWRPIRLATVSFGQGIAVTPAQMAQAVNVIANDGVRVPLRLTRAIGGEPQPFAPGSRVVSRRTAARMREILAGVVEEGTGRNAGVSGFAVAGKTGTAQKAVPGGYSETDYISSFAGFAPAETPLFTAVVILDTKKPNHSGAHAARVFGRIAARLLWRYRRAGRDAPVLVAGAGNGGARGFAGTPVDPDGRLIPASATEYAAGSARDAVAAALRGNHRPRRDAEPLVADADTRPGSLSTRNPSADSGHGAGLRSAPRNLATTNTDRAGGANAHAGPGVAEVPPEAAGRNGGAPRPADEGPALPDEDPAPRENGQPSPPQIPQTEPPRPGRSLPR